MPFQPSPHLRGSVTLVGAGPGDPDLLTLKAVKAIASATLVLVDDLVNDEVLTHARPSARIIYVGKRGGCTSTPQAFIEKLMIQSAREGHHVVRLKGGDPFIFGRGGEEVEHLQREGIAVEVINGITAGLAAATRLQVPLTHRDHAHGVVLVTGHAKPGDAGTDWAALALCAHQARLTLVIYMGIAHIERIEAGLRTHLPDHTPVAVVRHATLPDQQQAVGTLGGLATLVHTSRLGSPSIVVVGDVLHGLAATQQPASEGYTAAA